MKTDDLIQALAADAQTLDAPPRRGLVIASAVGIAVGALVFESMLGPRGDISAAAETIRFLFKFVVTGALALCAWIVAVRMVAPGRDLARSTRILWVPLALIGAAVVAELAAVPRDLWTTRMLGSNSMICLTSIPMIAAGPLAAMLIAMRRGAPENPALAGAIAGLAAAGIGATLYAAHCTDDSPLFVATWYTIAIGGVTGVGALLGSRLLRW